MQIHSAFSVSKNPVRTPFSPSAGKVLGTLELRARDSYAAIAKSTKLSHQLVQYHVREAQDSGFISEYNAVIDVALLGFTLNLIYFRFLGLTSANETKWIEHCSTLEPLMVISRAFGRWDATIAAVTKDSFELSRLINSLTAPISGKIADMSITTRTEVTYGSLDILAPTKRIQISSQQAHAATISIDQIDLSLLHILARHGRATTASLAEKVNLSPPAVAQRIRQLEKQGIILGYRAVYRYEELGYGHYRLFFKLSNTSDELINRVRNELFASGIVPIVSRHLGFADLDCRCWARSQDELYAAVRRLQDKFVENIIQVEIVAILRWHYLNHLPIPKFIKR